MQDFITNTYSPGIVNLAGRLLKLIVINLYYTVNQNRGWGVF